MKHEEMYNRDSQSAAGRGLKQGERSQVKKGERGGARLKFLLVMAVIAVCAYVAYLYIPVAYQAYLFKDAMQTAVDKAAVMGQNEGQLKEQLRADGREHEVPTDARITVENRDGRLYARVQYARPISFPGYNYQYNFDYTAKSTELFTSK
ncbi:MAG TPA: hypothetical protein VF507_09065 [Pyrinomonadaceae bacterium]|jgi:hypothetical protein